MRDREKEKERETQRNNKLAYCVLYNMEMCLSAFPFRIIATTQIHIHTSHRVLNIFILYSGINYVCFFYLLYNKTALWSTYLAFYFFVKFAIQFCYILFLILKLEPFIFTIL